MRGGDEVRTLCEQAVRSSDADETEALYLGHDTSLTRFANNHVHQNVAETDGRLTVRAVRDGRVGSAVTNDLSPEGIQMAVHAAAVSALAQSPNPNFPGLAPPAEAASVDVYEDAVAALSPAQRADGAGTICRHAEGLGLVTAGVYSSAEMEMGLANSNGASHYHRRTEVEVNAVMQGERGSGYAGRLGTRLGDIDPHGVAEEAGRRALDAQDPQDVQPGRYEVVLDTYAVHDVASFFARLGFGARALQEGRSFMAGRMGEQVMSPSVSFWDDGTDPEGLASPFDYEGTPKRKVGLITSGLASGVVYDRATAAAEGLRSTGHALPPGYTLGPQPLNLFMAGGDRSREDLIGGVERGILVTRFWYTRTVHPLSVVITGMTRDGTFLIEDGRVTKPLKNLRFTTSYLEALGDVRGIGRETALGKGYLGSTRVPALHLGSFNFTGATQF